jgi:hypothetical protein
MMLAKLRVSTIPHLKCLQARTVTYGIEGIAFPELRIIADFQAGCPTGALGFWPRILRG